MSDVGKSSKTTRKKRVKVLLPKDKQLDTEQKLAKRKAENPDVYNLPVSKHSVQDLTEYFVRVEEGTNRILPKEKRRYVVYLRKSTDDEAKQVRSLEDQRAECLELAHRLKITVDERDILEESASAKISGNRPIFDDMIMGFKTGKYHGLIAWSPDRISRNMKEAGEVIEMIDQEQIQDLQFKTYQFENNPNGKMLLGILFATSKQYSDKLSVDVSRGITGNIKDGKYTGVTKKGYYVDKSTGYFMPDGYNWDLLREAVNMRLYQGKNNIEIADFLNKSHLGVRKDQDEDHAMVKVDKQMVGDIFADPFYFGLYQYGKNKGRWLISFYCRNKDCQRYKDAENAKAGIKLKKSVRAGIVMAHIEWTLRNCTKKSKQAYRQYIDRLSVRLAQDTAIAKRKLAEAKKDLRTNEKQYARYQDFQIKHPADYKKHHTGKLEHHQQLINVAKHNIKKSEDELKRLGAGLPTEKEFYELVNSYLVTLLKTTDLMEQDTVCNELVLNLRVANDAVSVIKLNPPYDMLVDLTKISTGRGERTRTSGLLLPKQAR